MRAGLGRLPERERTVLAARFGLGGRPRETLLGLGRRLGMTSEWARRLERRALDRLRTELEACGVAGVPTWGQVVAAARMVARGGS